MFPALMIKRMMGPVRVKTEASFSADDPWNQNQPTAFTVEAYLMLMKSAKPKAGKKPLGASYLYGIRSDADGVERMLPDSLSEMWLKKRVATEALPRVLHEMQPTLKKVDYQPVLRNGGLKFICWFFALIGAFVGLLPLALVLFTSEITLSFAAPIALTTVFMMSLFLYFIYFRFKRRRVRQMQWIGARP